MLTKAIRGTTHWLRRAITEPRAELSRWQRAARFAYDLGCHGARQLSEDQAPQMAAALSYRTLFGLAPVLVVATVVVKAVKGSDAIRQSLHTLFVSAGLDKIHVVSPEAVGEASQASITLADWLQDLVGELSQVNVAAIGWVGFAVIVYAAISLMVTIEKCCNTICRAADGRSWARRIPLYWFVLTLSPVMIGLAAYADQTFTTWIHSVSAWHGLLLVLQWLWSFGLAWLFMLAVYTLVPHASLDLRPAVAGAFVAAVLLEVGKRTLGGYLGNAFAIDQLYGSLGLVPLFMFWVYLMWLSVLFGLQVSATLQQLRGRSLADIEQGMAAREVVDPETLLVMMELIAERFQEGQPTTAGDISAALSVAEATVRRVLERLVREGWLHQVERAEPAVSLAVPPDQLQPTTFLDMGHRWLDERRGGRRSPLVDSLRAAQHSVAEGVHGIGRQSASSGR